MKPLPHIYTVAAVGSAGGSVSIAGPAEGCLVANSLRCKRELQMEIAKAQVNEPDSELV